MRDLLRSDAVISLPTMFAGQLILTTAAYTLPVAAPAALPDMGVPAVFVGFFTSAIYLVAMTAGLFTGPLLSRLGTVRTMQCLLLAAFAGIVLFNLGWWATAALGAMTIGLGSGPMNPSGSYILARTTPPRWRPFVFSVKQCATPAGGMLAGIIVPAVLVRYGWQAAVGTVALGAVLVILAIQPARRRLDAERPPLRRVSPGSVIEPIKLVLRVRELRAISVMGYIYAGCQLTLASYLVVYLTERLALPIATAGALFAVFSFCGIPVRIFWGALAERVLSTRSILILTGFLMAAGFALTASFTRDWPVWALGLVTALLGLSANGWVGLFFAELVRIAPEDMAGDASGGGQFFAYGGIMSMPLIFGAIVAATGSYMVGFSVLTALSLGAAALLVASVGKRKI
ncbi:MAG: MFS transporter [Alphaproteobacteria bacterium]|nr:MFS transporter [Alphaproteobacteria bacterium]